MRLSDFDYELPEELIARHPPAQRGDSRLMVVPLEGEPTDRRIGDLPSLLRAGDLLVFNDTRVIRARLHGRKLPAGGRIEALIERIIDERCALAMVRASKTPREGGLLELGAGKVTVGQRVGEFHTLHFEEPVAQALDRDGEMPLPPYLERAAQAQDDSRYQTVFARKPGAVAAPTAGLHFDEALLERLQAAGIGCAFVTLHVGAGTFQPVREDEIARHRMHSERYMLPQATADAIARTRAAGGRLIAVGTTAMRTLESVADETGHIQAASGETELFIVPGHRFRAVDALITNFHLPRSTLLMLVSAFAGVARIRHAYAQAIARRYRFFSYGDAMLLTRCADARAQ